MIFWEQNGAVLQKGSSEPVGNQHLLNSIILASLSEHKKFNLSRAECQNSFGLVRIRWDEYCKSFFVINWSLISYASDTWSLVSASTLDVQTLEPIPCCIHWNLYLVAYTSTFTLLQKCQNCTGCTKAEILKYINKFYYPMCILLNLKATT